MVVCLCVLGVGCDGDGKIGVDGTSCGPGTHEVAGQCVLDGTDDTDDASGSDTDGSGSDTDGGADSDVPEGAITVCAEGSADWSELQDAVDASRDGDTIALCPGTYAYVQISGKTLTIVGTAGRSRTTIAGVKAHPAVLVDTSTLTLSGVSLTGVIEASSATASLSVTSATVTFNQGRVAGVRGGAFDGTLIGASDSDLTLDDVVVEDNSFRGVGLSQDAGTLHVSHTIWTGTTAASGVAPMIFAISNTEMIIANNLIYNNEVGYHAFRVLDPVAGSKIMNNTWHGDTRVSGSTAHPFEVDLNGDPVFTNNIVEASTNCSGIRSSETHPVNLTYNLSFGHDAGVDFSFDASSTHNVVIDPKFVDAAHGDFHLAPDSPARGTGNPSNAFDNIDGSRSDLGAFGGPGGQW